MFGIIYTERTDLSEKPNKQGVTIMTVNYIGKKTVVRDSFKEYAEKRMKKLGKFFDDDPVVNIIVTNHNEDETVEAISVPTRELRHPMTARPRWTWYWMSCKSRLYATRTGWKSAGNQPLMSQPLPNRKCWRNPIRQPSW